MAVQTLEKKQTSAVVRQGTVAELIVAQLGAWGINTIYGVSGDAIFSLLDATAHQDTVRFFPTVHEFSAAYMALTSTRLTGHPAVCTATSGPGTVNLLNGLAEAYRDRVPLLAITGDVKSPYLGLNVKQGINQQQLLAAVTGYSAVIKDPTGTLAVLQEAMRVAVEQQTAVHVSIPKDVFKMATSGTLLPLPPSLEQSQPQEGDFQQVANMLKGFSRPLILAGQETRDAHAEIGQLAETLGAGIILAQGAKGVIPGAHPLVLGGLGEAFIPAPLDQADVLLIIGTAPYEMSYLPVKLPVIQIASRPEYIKNAPAPPKASLIGDVRDTLQKLITSMVGYQPVPEWRGMLATAHHDWLRQAEDDSRDHSVPLTPRRLAAELNRLLAPDAILAIDVGEFMHWFDRSFIGHRQRLILSDYWRCMGSALPSAIAAKVLYPDQQVVVIAGDGGFLMSMFELVTAAKNNLPVKVIIFNNGQYALEKHKMAGGGQQPLGIDLVNPDFVVFAQACGADGYNIEEPAQLAGVLSNALNSDRPALIDVKVSSPVPPFIKA